MPIAIVRRELADIGRNPFMPLTLIGILAWSIPHKGMHDERRHEARRRAMVQTTGRLYDEFAKLMNDAAGVAQGVKREFDSVMRTQAERILRDLDVVHREEFEAVKEMARRAREENEALKERIAALEAKLATPSGG
jgi:BMFP domain-containing protein YqiC